MAHHSNTLTRSSTVYCLGLIVLDEEMHVKSRSHGLKIDPPQPGLEGGTATEIFKLKTIEQNQH